MEKSGVELAAEGAGPFTRAMTGARNQIGGLGDQAEKASKQGGLLSKAMKGISDIAKGGFKLGLLAAGAAVGALVAGIGAAIAIGSDWANKLDSVGDVLGTTAKESAALAVAVEGVGGDVNAFATNLAFMQKNLETTEGTLGSSGQALESLGVSFRDADGSMRPLNDLLPEIATTINALPDGLQKTELQMQIFGKSGKDLTDVMGALANDGLAQAAQRAEQFGLAISDETVAKTVQVGKDMEVVKQAASGLATVIFQELLAALSPMISDFREFVETWAPKAREWLETNIPKAIAVVKGAFTDVQTILREVFGIGGDAQTGFQRHNEEADKVPSHLEPIITTLLDVKLKVEEVSAAVTLWVEEVTPHLQALAAQVGSRVDSGTASVSGAFNDLAATWGENVIPAANRLVAAFGTGGKTGGGEGVNPDLVTALQSVVTGVQANFDPFTQLTNHINTATAAAEGFASIMNTVAGWLQWAGQQPTVNWRTGEITYPNLPGDTPNYENIPRQHGGPVWPGQDFMVGESGPERVRFSSPGYVYPSASPQQIYNNSRSYSYSNQVTNNITMPIYTNNTPAVLPQSLGMMRALVG